MRGFLVASILKPKVRRTSDPPKVQVLADRKIERATKPLAVVETRNLHHTHQTVFGGLEFAMFSEEFVATADPPAAHPFQSEILSELLAAASAAFDSDHDSAKTYLRRAEELVRVGRKERQPSVAEARVFLRGGLAAWQRNRLTTYVQANIGSNIHVADLATLVRLSKGHFFRAFRETFGEAPGSYIARQRIRQGQSLMLNSRARLSEIALACGMCDQPHFTRVFGKFVGLSPRAWRRKFAGDPEGIAGPRPTK
jgi:AraC family transcriptional regulator